MGFDRFLEDGACCKFFEGTVGTRTSMLPYTVLAHCILLDCHRRPGIVYVLGV